MDILKQWKAQKGIGTYVPKDSESLIKVVKHLMFSIDELGQGIRCIAPEPSCDKYKEAIDIRFQPHDTGVFPKDKVFLFIIIDVNLIPKEVLSIMLMANPHRFLFCTSSIDAMHSYHLSVAPIIISSPLKSSGRNISKYSKVDYNVALDLAIDDQRIYDNYSSKMIDIFDFFGGDFNLIGNCYRGDHKAGITADVFRREFAKANNWNDTMDTSIEYYAEVDKHYNPNSIYEKAKVYTDLLASRSHFVDEHRDKAYFVSRLVAYHNTKRFLIVCKNNYMADVVYNLLSKAGKCGVRAIHNEIPNVQFLDEDNKVITYKSGAKKGEPKMFGAKSQIDKYVNWFNTRQINVLVSTSAMPKGLDITGVDCIVYLSPRCISYVELQKRVNIAFNNTVNILNVYFLGTKDERLIRANQKDFKHNVRNYFKGDLSKINLD